jgi:CBS domain-containing protein
MRKGARMGEAPECRRSEEGSEMKVQDCMTTDVKTVRPEASLKDAAAIVAEHAIGGMPVVDERGQVVGVITKTDILFKELGEPPQRGLRGLLHRGETSALTTKVEAHTVGEAMSTPAVTAEQIWSTGEAADVLLEHGINRLPVVEDDQLVGIITRHDLVQAFARSDEEIERDIREEALTGLSWPEDLRVEVRDGEVRLDGEVESRYDAEQLPGSIRRIPGVVKVDSRLVAWDPDGKKKVLVELSYS